MQTYISFLRGVNMTGHNSIRMTDLSALYKNLGFNDAETYIQSGNVIFSSMDDVPVPEIASTIERSILKRFNYNVPVLIRTVEEMRKLISANPFIEERNFEPSKMAVMLLYEKTTKAQIQKVIDIDYPPDKFKIIGKEIFIYCPNGFGRTKLYTNFFEKKMGVTGTARNWKTITTILQIAEKK
ncbi:MAG: DUF1697 domain-containing protein [Bacteroidia bacterium]|nr:DUF1697 domain-containing protein [Bacteroidia bacterium]